LSEAVGFVRFGGEGKTSIVNALVNFGDVAWPELVRRETTRSADEGFGDVLDLITAREGEILGTE